MTTFEKITAAIEPFGYPHAPDFYPGSADCWFTYNYVSDFGTNYSDDGPETIIVKVQVHLYLPVSEDFIILKNLVRNALFEQEFTFPKVTVSIDEGGEHRHIVFECDTEEEVT